MVYTALSIESDAIRRLFHNPSLPMLSTENQSATFVLTKKSGLESGLGFFPWEEMGFTGKNPFLPGRNGRNSQGIQ